MMKEAGHRLCKQQALFRHLLRIYQMRLIYSIIDWFRSLLPVGGFLLIKILKMENSLLGNQAGLWILQIYKLSIVKGKNQVLRLNLIIIMI